MTSQDTEASVYPLVAENERLRARLLQEHGQCATALLNEQLRSLAAEDEVNSLTAENERLHRVIDEVRAGRDRWATEYIQAEDKLRAVEELAVERVFLNKRWDKSLIEVVRADELRVALGMEAKS